MPPATPDGAWLTIYEAVDKVYRDGARRLASTASALKELLNIMKAYREASATEFNEALGEYGELHGDDRRR